MKIQNIFRMIPVLAVAAFLSACGEPVEVPPAHVGKILTADGFKDTVLPPSKFRLDPCFSLCDKLVIAEASDYSKKEVMTVFMPKDDLNLTVEVRGIFAVSNEDDNVNRIFARIPAQATNQGSTSSIPMDTVYETYAAQIIREVVRSGLANYEITEVMNNRDRIGAELHEKISNRLELTPITVAQFGLADVQPPEVIVRAKEAAKEREIEIQRTEADKQIALKKAEAELELADKDQQIRLKKAETIREENKIVADSVTDAYIEYRRLEVLEEAAKSDATIFFPIEMTESAGLQHRVFSTQKANSSK